MILNKGLAMTSSQETQFIETVSALPLEPTSLSKARAGLFELAKSVLERSMGYIVTARNGDLALVPLEEYNRLLIKARMVPELLTEIRQLKEALEVERCPTTSKALHESLEAIHKNKPGKTMEEILNRGKKEKAT